MSTGPKLHVGCGKVHLDGWINIDNQNLPTVDVVADVTTGLDFKNVEAVYAEHFLEHLRVDGAMAFLKNCHQILADDGLIRLSTPNLDWVYLTHYQPHMTGPPKIEMAIRINRAFHGWEHQFLWNRDMLTEALEACGFADLSWCRYGESEHDVFRGIEHHETYEDDDDLPHVLLVEARKGQRPAKRLKELERQIGEDFLAHLHG